MAHKKPENTLNDLKQQNADYVIAITRRDEKIRALKLTIQDLEAQLYSERTSRAALKRLYQGVDRKILGSIHDKGKKKPDMPKSHPAVQSASGDYRSLIQAARAYDAEEFFKMNRPATSRTLRFPYHVLAVGYVRTRNSGIKIAKKIYKRRSNA